MSTRSSGTWEASPPVGDARGALLLAAPSELGARWVDVWFETCRAEGRKIDGGWPGTRPEARSRLQEYLDRELAVKHMPLLTADELDTLTTAMYQRARSDWSVAVRAGKAPLQGSDR